MVVPAPQNFGVAGFSQVIIYLTYLTERTMIPGEEKAFRWGDFRYRQISLWNILKKVNVSQLFEHSAGLTRFAGHQGVWDRLSMSLSPGTAVEAVLRDPDVKKEYLGYLARIGAACSEADLPISAMAVQRLIDTFEMGALGQQDFESQLRDIRRRMEDELRARTFLQIEPSDAGLYEQPLEQWLDVIDRFPSCQRDVEEASKCLALDRCTAAVFHLMKVLEPALGAIARALEVQKQSPTWHAYLTAFRAAYTAKFPSKTASDKEWVEFYSGLEAHLAAIKTAWRNPTMHAVELSYTKDQGLDICNNVRAFMRLAATKLLSE